MTALSQPGRQRAFERVLRSVASLNFSYVQLGLHQFKTVEEIVGNIQVRKVINECQFECTYQHIAT